MVVHSQSGNITCSGSLHGTIDLSTERDGVIKKNIYVKISVILMYLIRSYEHRHYKVLLFD
jgi:hypothetical protein